jgi:hypothetical protein
VAQGAREAPFLKTVRGAGTLGSPGASFARLAGLLDVVSATSRGVGAHCDDEAKARRKELVGPIIAALEQLPRSPSSSVGEP